jgi:predicted DNA-binding protein YlxM (UPF0122 family)
MTNNLPASSAPKYIPIETLIEYRKKGLTLEEIGTLTGITKQSVSERIRNADLEGLEQFNDHKDKVFEHKQREIVKSLTDAKVKEMSGLQLITGAAILQDKIMALRGQASTIIDHRHLTVDLNRAIEQLRNEQGNAPLPVDNSDVIECPTANIT